MTEEMNKEMTNTELLEAINKSFSLMEEKMVTKDEFLHFKMETSNNFGNLESDLKSFKSETRESFSEINKKIDDLYDTDRGYDKRIENLELKTHA